MPPATTSRSRPSARLTCQSVPNGPRTPTMSPGAASHRARVTAPTLRIVCASTWSRKSTPTSMPLTDTGTSPMPNVYSMVN
jgi:hypothetical protein